LRIAQVLPIPGCTSSSSSSSSSSEHGEGTPPFDCDLEQFLEVSADAAGKASSLGQLCEGGSGISAVFAAGQAAPAS